MSNHVDRMRAEHTELRKELAALNQFVFSDEKFKELDDLEQARMLKQSRFMEEYLKVLESSIWHALGD